MLVIHDLVTGLPKQFSAVPRSLNWPLCASYSCVPLMMTVCAGRFTPHARVAVVHSTCHVTSIELKFTQFYLYAEVKPNRLVITVQ